MLAGDGLELLQATTTCVTLAGVASTLGRDAS
jgi:hypothetical protein